MSIKLPSIAISKDKHPKYVYYTSSKDIQEGEAFRFGTMADMFIMAALMGYHLGRPKAFASGEKLERPMKWDVFIKNEVHLHIIKSICILHFKGDPRKANILLDNEEMANLIEQYANGGITHLLSALEDGPDFEGNMISMIKRYES